MLCKNCKYIYKFKKKCVNKTTGFINKNNSVITNVDIEGDTSASIFRLMVDQYEFFNEQLLKFYL